MYLDRRPEIASQNKCQIHSSALTLLNVSEMDHHCHKQCTIISRQKNLYKKTQYRIFMSNKVLELRQYKNDSTEPKNRLILKLARFLIAYTLRKKARQFPNQPIFLCRRVVLTFSQLWLFSYNYDSECFFSFTRAYLR